MSALRQPRALLYVLLAGMLGLLWLSLSRPAAYRVLVREDGLVEWLTAIGLLAVAVALFQRWRARGRREGRVWRAVVMAAAAAALFGFGEEISWGQRIVGYEVAEGSLVAVYNLQGETNLHNLGVGGVKVNKLVFTWRLGLVLLGYFAVYPLATRLRPGVRARFEAWGVPTPRGAMVIVAALAAVVAQAIPLSRNSEAFELVLPVLALVVVLEWGGERTRGASGRQSARRTSPAHDRTRCRVRRAGP